MKAIYLIKQGEADEAFEIRESNVPEAGENEILIRVETFGLNFADVMTRRGLYKDAPPLPAVIGYEVVGIVESFGDKVGDFEKGDKVLAFTRFGAYAEYAVADQRAVVKLAADTDNAIATALCTQYCTAWYAAYYAAGIKAGERILIHAAAGGVGLALVEICQLENAEVYATVGSDEKIAFLKERGIEHSINYRNADFVKWLTNTDAFLKMDVIFDPIGGKNFKQSKSLLGAGGRIITYGASSQLDGRKGLINSLRTLFGFGFFSPVGLIMSSTGILGVNMLRIADQKPDLLQSILKNVVQHYEEGKIKPYIAKTFSADKIHEAHHYLESRSSIGKIAVNWE